MVGVVYAGIWFWSRIMNMYERWLEKRNEGDDTAWPRFDYVKNEFVRRPSEACIYK